MDLGLSGPHLAALKEQLLKIHREVQDAVDARTPAQASIANQDDTEPGEQTQRSYAEHVLLSAMRAAKGFRSQLLSGEDMSHFVPGGKAKHNSNDGVSSDLVSGSSSSVISEIVGDFDEVRNCLFFVKEPCFLWPDLVFTPTERGSDSLWYLRGHPFWAVLRRF